jgi:hypothetical protein
MSYEIIPNWTYLGKPVYTNTKDNTLLDMPVNIPIAIPVATTYASNYTPTNRNSSIKKLDSTPLYKSVKYEPVFSFSNPNYGSGEIEKIIKTKTMYREIRGKSGNSYERLGKYIRHLITPDGETVYYFDENPEMGYNKLKLYYDTSETDELSNKKAGTRKTRKNRKRK